MSVYGNQQSFYDLWFMPSCDPEDLYLYVPESLLNSTEEVTYMIESGMMILKYNFNQVFVNWKEELISYQG